MMIKRMAGVALVFLSLVFCFSHSQVFAQTGTVIGTGGEGGGLGDDGGGGMVRPLPCICSVVLSRTCMSFYGTKTETKVSD